ncbi:Tat pathway signal protein [Primorskyibacter sp. S187A]|uniref:Tat pathway signal protein n=1 Tax=Primorskyibacter sp. S187A TaxID=3415130 RepID=UPI003C7B8255
MSKSPALSRRGFIAATLAAGSMRALPGLQRAGGKRVLTLVYDKSIGAMRAIDRIVR